jgi:alkylhydroperoxidase family enzyme
MVRQMRARLQKLLEVLLGSDDHHPELRRAAAARAASLAGSELPATSAPLPPALAGWVELVARTAWRITDDDVAALRAAGFDEDAIFETTIAAATGAAVARYQIAMRALKS